MALVQPFTALVGDPAVAGPLARLVAPPYDVIDPAQRKGLAARSPYNAVHVDLPEDPAGGDPYAHAAHLLVTWAEEGALVRDEPALWALSQEFTGPDGRTRTRNGILARVRIEPYGPGRIRPHERTHPGPKEDRLRLTRATRANLSPIFALHGDPDRRAWAAVAPTTESADPWGEATDEHGVRNRLWRVGDTAAHEEVAAALADAELLIADGHHRYETARVYADEVGGDGPHRHVLMCLVALEDPGLAVFPTHRLVGGLRDDDARHTALLARIDELFSAQDVAVDDLRPPDGAGPLVLGYLDGRTGASQRLVLRDQALADDALADFPEPYRRLDTAVLEALVLQGALGLTEDDISHMHGLGYSRTDDEAITLVRDGTFDAAFLMRASPVSQVQEIAAAGVNMPPKSTFFMPKVPTGLVYHPLV